MRLDPSEVGPRYRGKPRFVTTLAVLTVVALHIATAQGKTPIVDGDADGVDDAVDQCLYTPPRAAVDARGCSAQSDQDGDGIADAGDDCPYTPPGAEVDARGCAVDDDFDGVANGLDACAGTELGALVDTRGCASGQFAKAIEPKPHALRPAVAQSGAVLSSAPPPVVAAAMPVIAPAVPVIKPALVPAPAAPPIVSPPVPTSAPAPPTGAAAQPRAPVRIVIPAPPTAMAPAAVVVATPALAAPAPHSAALMSLSFGAQNNNIGAASMARIDKALPALRAALAANRRSVLLVEGYADTESDGDAADTVARSRANALRRALENQGLDGKRLRSVGHHAVDAGAEFRRADVVLEAE